MALIVDSSVFIGIERQGRSPDALTSIDPDELVAVAAITASELLAGVYRADSLERRLRREAFVGAVLELIPVVPFDLRVARTYAQLWAQRAAEGNQIGTHDLLIVATAIAYGYAVLTDNVRDFDRVPGLDVKQPAW